MNGLDTLARDAVLCARNGGAVVGGSRMSSLEAGQLVRVRARQYLVERPDALRWADARSTCALVAEHDDEELAKLVALNAERAKEEQRAKAQEHADRHVKMPGV